MVVEAKKDYIFNTNAVGNDDEITEDHWNNGRISDEVFDNYDFWSWLNGTEVTVISVIAVKKIGGCDEWAKVFIKDKGVDWWFSAPVSELSAKGPINNPGGCKCDLAVIMVRGCQCGGN